LENASTPSKQTDERFAFGKNWADYAATVLDEPRIETATQALKELLGLDSLKGLTFLDIGSGSGLHSLAAYRLGADQIISFDYDVDSVRTTETLRAKVGNSLNWQIFQGSILDDTLAAKYHASIVYSWGVLHHTGDMWNAIRNAAKMVEPGGIFCIAIYNKVERTRLTGTSAMWKKIKRAYVNSPEWRKRVFVWATKLHFIVMQLRWLRNPIREIRNYNTRGMTWHNDVVDWVGGYPFEYATVEEIKTFCEHEFGFRLLKVVPRSGHSNNEFVFQAPR
jgi:2-polyprenyl-3-methyl-5-hydroxy-6-metoxy-1,4-benzoquinol methylase